MTTNNPEPKRGEVWKVELDPTRGAEMKKTRTSVVVSSDAMGILPIKLIAPITEWNQRYSTNTWHVKLLPDDNNGLTKESSVDTLQLRGLDYSRFKKKLGNLAAEDMEEIVTAIAAVVEFT